MNERNLKRLGYVGVGLQVTASVIMMGNVAVGMIFDICSIIPDFVVDLSWTGLVIALISIFLRIRLRRYKELKKH